jgi:hypothetical protein
MSPDGRIANEVICSGSVRYRYVSENLAFYSISTGGKTAGT